MARPPIFGGYREPEYPETKQIIFDSRVYRNAGFLVGDVGSINYAPASHDLLPAPARSRTSHSAPPAPRQSGRRPVSAGTCAAPTWALHPPARVRGDGRAAEEAEAESALGRALHRQRHHRAASVHGLPAHLVDAGPERRARRGPGRAGKGGAGRGCGLPGTRAHSPGPCAPSPPGGQRAPAGGLRGRVPRVGRAAPSRRAPARARRRRRAGAPASRSRRSRAAPAPRARGRACWRPGAAAEPASWPGEGVVWAARAGRAGLPGTRAGAVGDGRVRGLGTRQRPRGPRVPP